MRKEIEHDKRKMADIKNRALSTTSTIGSVNSPNVSDKVGNAVADLSVVEERYKEHIEKCTKIEMRITDFINSIPDARTRLIFKLRFLDNRSWVNIAWKVGGYATEDSVKKIVYRYIRQNSNR